MSYVVRVTHLLAYSLAFLCSNCSFLSLMAQSGTANNRSNGSDLRVLIESRIPDERAGLEDTCANLEKVARYCEENYYNHPVSYPSKRVACGFVVICVLCFKDKHAALEETKQYALQSLASVAYQIDALSKVRISVSFNFVCYH